MEKLNLCEILKGHEGETFYMYGQGDCTLVLLNDNQIDDYPILVRARFHHENGYDECDYSLKSDGTIGTDDLMLFPSKDQRDWNEWIEEQKSKIPKTWSELEEVRKCKVAGAIIAKTSGHEWFTGTYCESPTEKSALAFLKISQLIEVGYGGNVSYEELDAGITYGITPVIDNNTFTEFYVYSYPISVVGPLFHSIKQAEEFLSYPENVQLLKDYFQIN